MAVPVTPRTRTVDVVLAPSPSVSATFWITAERLAPVSSTSRKGPWPFRYTGAQILPMRSRRVGAT